MRISVYGAGSWGTALASILASTTETQHRVVTLWARDAGLAQEMQAQRENQRRLPGIHFPPSLTVTSDFSIAAQADWHIVATPVSALRTTAERLRAYAPAGVIWLCKGIEADTQLMPHQIVEAVLPGVRSAALSGPSFAQEAAQGLPFALVCASTNLAFATSVAETLHHGTMRVYSSEDLVGVEIGGAAKNVMAIAAGITDGLQLGANARAALITRGLAEISRLGLALGARLETFMGLAGIGDLILTCTGDLSRNRRVGLALAQGQSIKHITTTLGATAEGVFCAPALLGLAQRLGIDMPITRTVHAILFQGLAPREGLQQLMNRPRPIRGELQTPTVTD